MTSSLDLDKDMIGESPANELAVTVRKRLVHESANFQLDVDSIFPTGFTILFGASGAGKTTLLDCIAGLVTSDAGRISVGNEVLFDMDLRINHSARIRCMGYVFQDLALFPHLSVEKNIDFGLSGIGAAERRQRSQTIMESFRIAHLAKRKPSEVSGGERQRVALARTLVTDPRVLLLDEPLDGLDAPTKSKIIDDLRVWNQAHQVPILYVTHSRDEVFALGDRMLIMEAGKIVARGTPHEVMTAPRQEFIAQLAGFENIFHAKVIAIHEDRGTLICRLSESNVELETPLLRARVGEPVRVGIRAGDILLATILPSGLSARNIIPGRVKSLAQHDVISMAKVDCGVEMTVQLTLAARDSLQLQPGREVWLIVKTHSCHLMAE